MMEHVNHYMRPDFLVDKKILFKAEIGESNGQAAISLKNRIS